MNGSIGGALGKKASWFGSVFRRDNASNSIINADLLDANSNVIQLHCCGRESSIASRHQPAVRFPARRQEHPDGAVHARSPEADQQRRFAVRARRRQAYNVANYENTLQVSDTQMLSANTVNETRFQYIRARDNQIAQNTDPTVTVQGAFTGGGSNAGVVRDNQDRFELENYTTEAKGAHAIEFGGRLRLTRDANYSTSGFNGNYIYSSLVSLRGQEAVGI